MTMFRDWESVTPFPVTTTPTDGRNEYCLSTSGTHVLKIPGLRFHHNNTRTLAGFELVSKDQSIFCGL